MIDAARAHDGDAGSRCARYRGHFYNWYDLHDLQRARAGVHQHRRQRQPRRPPDRAAPGLSCPRGTAVGRASARDCWSLADAGVRAWPQMDFAFLYDRATASSSPSAITPTTLTPTSPIYDLLASEARLAELRRHRQERRAGGALVPAVALPDIAAAGATALVSWSGSMFEYLMPLLVMRSLPFTLLDQTYRGVRSTRHMRYGASGACRGESSESAYNCATVIRPTSTARSASPDLALKRGLGSDLVIAPYAIGAGGDGRPAAGARESAAAGAARRARRPTASATRSTTRGRTPGSRFAFVRTYMAHHIGMTLVALTNVLRNDLWQRPLPRRSAGQVGGAAAARARPAPAGRCRQAQTRTPG